MLDPAEAAAALTDANLSVLISTLAYLTHDSSLLDRYDAAALDHGRGRATIGSAEADDIRAEALEILSSLDFDESTRRPPTEAMLHRIVNFCAGEDVAAEYVPMVVAESNFDGTDPRRFEWTRQPAPEPLAAFRVAIIGGGLGGVCAAIRLEQLGIPYVLIEKNAGVGGTWFENTYPGLRVDVPNHFYSYSFAPNPGWSSYYAERREIAQYVERCARDHGVLPHARCNTEVVGATYDDASACWSLRLRTDKSRMEETLEANVVISAVGMLNRPVLPDIDGLDSFEGPWFHSSRWDHGLDIAGRRVAVVGTGASAMQIVPELARDVSRLFVFQRSRHWVTPNPLYHRPVSAGERWLFANVPAYAGWYRFLQFWNSSDRMYPAFRRDPSWPEPERAISRQNDKLRALMTEHLRRELAARPDLVERVLPDYPALGKRILQDNGWFRALLRDNVELVSDGIAKITTNSVVTESGAEHDVDVLVFATGFHANKYLWPMEIASRGVDLCESWGDDPRAYLGITVPGFPNLFLLYGPNTNPVVGSVVFMLEAQVDYVVRAIAALLDNGYAAIECRQDVHDAYNARVDAENEEMVWRHPKVHSYYNNRYGRVTTNAPWRLLDYWRMTREPALSDFVLTRGIPRSLTARTRPSRAGHGMR
jgi:4-hydroxyacetophenone monooxygenase